MKTGTKEWAEHSVNCCLGCSHNCRYCYARQMAVRFGTCTVAEWPKERALHTQVDKHHRKYRGRVMFPTTHDITPGNRDACYEVLRKLLNAGNEVLVVSKPHLECIGHLCRQFSPFKERLTFRFSIGGISGDLLRYWEPGAPRYLERYTCLAGAFSCGYNTSVSIEPLLEYDRVHELVDEMNGLVTDTIWIGKMNQVRSRVAIKTDEDVRMAMDIEENQTDAKIWALYESLKHHPKVRWKDSIKRVVGLKLATETG